MPRYLRPGAYTERSDAAQSNRLLLRSDVPAFIGIAEKGPLDTPVPVESFRQFQAYFGNFIGAGYLAYSVRAFFDNGGRRCWVVRVASRSFETQAGSSAHSAEVVIRDLNGDPAWQISAFSEGSWGNRLELSLLEESLADTAIATGELRALYAMVTTTAGFARGSLVRINQEDSSGVLNEFFRVVSFVDAEQRRLYWVHPRERMGLPYDSPLSGFDPNRPARITSVTYRINVFQDQDLLAMYSGLSLIPEHADYAPSRLAVLQLDNTKRRQPRVAEIPEPIVVTSNRPASTEVPLCLQFEPLTLLALRGGQDGLNQLSHTDFIGQDFAVTDSDRARRRKSRGIACLNRVGEITLLAVPDIVIQPQPDPEYRPEPPLPVNPCLPCPPPPEPTRSFSPRVRSGELPPVFGEAQIYQVQAAMVAHCESRADRFAVIDPPHHIADDPIAGMAEIRAWRSRFDSSYAALYFPWVKVIDPRKDGEVRSIPPSGHALGQYALFDNRTGVHRAPANSPLRWIQDLSLHTSFGQQEQLNPLAINLLRSDGPRGIRIMGARTLSSDPDWIYVNVRRLLIMIRRALDIISQWVVFEPNHAATRNKFRVAISSYLEALWIRGALTGEDQQQAFFVKCDEENNPGQQRNNGQLLAEIGVAPSHPFEFVVVRVGVQENELKIRETGAVATTE
ncbi:MAG: phage tail sheath family protein [Gammaproteobacteria bacterium]|nr:phage tail sheath family protein [Gammaproteobacteria bacterium]